MRRRDFIALTGAAGAVAAFPGAAFAQQPGQLPRIAFGDGGAPVADQNANSSNPATAAFFNELPLQGMVEGRTVLIDRFYAPSGNAEDTARRIIASAPDLIVMRGAVTTALAVAALTKTVPMISSSGEPLGQGIVTNLAHPGGNVTAVASAAGGDSEGKVLSLLAEAIPMARLAAYIGVGPGGQFNPAQQGYVRSAVNAAQRLGLAMTAIPARDPADESAFREALTMARDAKAEIIQFGYHTQIQTNSALLARLALEFHVPTQRGLGAPL